MNRLPPALRFTLATTLVFLTGCGKEPAKADVAKKGPGYTTMDQKVSYGIGHNMGSSLGREKALQLDRAAFMAGFEEGMAGKEVSIPVAELEAAFSALQQKAQIEAAAEGQRQLTAGKEFLAKNKARSGVKTTASGLQYEVLKAGAGPKPKATDTVRVHYHGTLIDGTVFDSSVARGQPLEIALNQVIKGWTEGMQLMPVGSKWKFTIPADIGYGPQARGKIPANAVLVFEVELLGIK